jgi:hypothetical protein
MAQSLRARDQSLLTQLETERTSKSFVEQKLKAIQRQYSDLNESVVKIQKELADKNRQILGLKTNAASPSPMHQNFL